MTVPEIRAAINFGKDAIKEYRDRGQIPPAWIFDRIFELYEMLAEALSIGE